MTVQALSVRSVNPSTITQLTLPEELPMYALVGMVAGAIGGAFLMQDHRAVGGVLGAIVGYLVGKAIPAPTTTP